MAQKLLSVTIGHDIIRICEIVRGQNKNLILLNAGEASTPRGSIDDGYIWNVPVVADAIQRLMKEKYLSGNKIIFSITSKNIIQKELIIPNLKSEKRIGAHIKANCGEYFPTSKLENSLFGYVLLETTETENSRQYRVQAAVAPKELIYGYMELARELKIPIETIDYSGNSILQILMTQMREESVRMVLQIEKEMTFVTILHGKTMVLQRIIPYGKNAIVNSLMEIMGLTEREAQELLRNESMMDRKVTHADYSQTIRYLIASIERILEYYNSKYPKKRIESLKIFGEGSNLAGIDKLIEWELNTPVSYFNQFSNLTIRSSRPLDDYQITSFFPNLGATIDSMKFSINDVGIEELEKNEQINRFLKLIICGSGIASVLMVGVTLIIFYGGILQKNNLISEIEKLKNAEIVYQKYEEIDAKYQKIVEYYYATESENSYIYNFINDLELITSENLWIETISATKSEIVVSGTTTNKELITTFIEELKKQYYIQDVFVSDITQMEGLDQKVTLSFTLTCLIQSAE